MVEKNETLNDYKESLNKLLALDKYISKKDYMSLYNKYQNDYQKLSLMEDEKVLVSWCANKQIEYSKLKELLNFYHDTEKMIQKHNDLFIKNHLIKDKEYLDTILDLDNPHIDLDEQQRKVVLADEDYTLVIAGAGAGKTTTIEAKVKYLIEKQDVSPNRILIISFTKKATKELQDRFKKLKLDVNISTFHGIANKIIKNEENIRHNIATGDIMFTTIKNFMINNITDEVFVKNILLFFASYLTIPSDEQNLSILINELSKNDCTTMRSDLKKTLEEYKQKTQKQKRTLKDERVRSTEECQIANFLFINGIDYEYEPVYKYGFKDTIKPYCPDFLIRQYDKEIYLEHFGISQDGKNSRFSQEELELYKKHINDKIKLHRAHNTKLIYTFSQYNDHKDLIYHLKEELKKAGISFEHKQDQEIYKTLLQNMEDKYFNKFIQLICVFISRFKTNNFTLSKFDEWKITLKDERTKLFVSIAYQCYLAYTNELKNRNSIDFEDMINNAANILDNKIKNKENLPYDYIFVDEYQDISMQRFDLCEKLSKCSQAKIIAVGDDWQSIFKFSGARIDLFTKFKEMMGYANVLKIVKTYRNAKELIDIAGGFVMTNDKQIKKELKSDKSISDPVILMSYNDKYEKNKNKPLEQMGLAIVKSLDMIVKNSGEDSSVLLIGRYGFEGFSLAKLEEHFVLKNNKLYSLKYPRLKITYLTAHSSKGLGYDNVIIINGKDAILGFPSKIVDDPIMKLVIKDSEEQEYAEERRLFYVALTRTKNRVFLITPIYKPSKFILEIKDKFKNVILKGEGLKPMESLNNKLKCPYCSYPLQKRENSNFKNTSSVWVCSNDPEICGFITNDLKGGKLAISKCPNCEDGYLVVKKIKNKENKEKRVLGCTNYKEDKTGCNTIMMDYNYTQDKEEYIIKFQDENLDINKVRFCNHLFIELVDIIIKTVKKYQNYKISIGPKMLYTILTGGTSKLILMLKINEDPYFGCIDGSDKKKYFVLFNSLLNNSYIKMDKNDFGRLSTNIEKLEENDYKIILAGMKL